MTHEPDECTASGPDAGSPAGEAKGAGPAAQPQPTPEAAAGQGQAPAEADCHGAAQPPGAPMAGDPQMGQPAAGYGAMQMGRPADGHGAPQIGQPAQGYGSMDAAHSCGCESQTAGPQMGQPGPMGAPQMAGPPPVYGAMPQGPDAHADCQCQETGPQYGGPQMGQPGPAGGPQPHTCSHGGMHPGPMPGMPFPGPMPGMPFPGPTPGMPFPGPMPGYAPGAPFGGSPGCGPANSPMGQALFQKDAQFGQMLGVFDDILNGKPDVSKMASLLGPMDGSFWKGALVGAALAFLISTPAVTNSMGGLFAGLFGGGGNEETSDPQEG